MDIRDLAESCERALSEGRLDQAEGLARRIVEADPQHARSWSALGMVAARKNDLAKAIPLLQRARALDPNSVQATLWLSVILRKSGQPGALELAEAAVALAKDDGDARNQLGMCLIDVGNVEGAIEHFSYACRLSPDNPASIDNLGRALQASGRTGEAIEAFSRVVQLSPAKPSALLRLADAYLDASQSEKALECAEAALRLQPNSPNGILLMARALLGLDKAAEAVAYAERAVSLAPGNPVPPAFLGLALQGLGRIEAANEQYRKSIRISPVQGFSYNTLVHNHKVTADERPLIATMQELSQDPRLPRIEVLQLEYGLGKAHEDLGEYAMAMRHFDLAKRIDAELKPGVAPFDGAELDATAEFLERTFDESFFEFHRDAGSGSELPIFVVGMMRSGTTLCEQILSCHPEIGGAGEHPFWPNATQGSCRTLFGSEEPGSFEDGRLKQMADSYLAILAHLYPSKQRIVDKMTVNYLFLGLLHVAFPNARIIHMVRHPVDTCLSTWAAPVGKGINLRGSKQDLVVVYRNYLRVVELWRRVLPSNCFLDVRYEELVADQERVSRQMIEFCGLEWNDACMSPEQNRRAVRTPSAWQVRQPVYQTSVERWRRYEPWLGEFAQLLPTK